MSLFIRVSFLTLTILLASGCGAFIRTVRTATRPHADRSIGIEGAINVSSGEAPTPTPGFQGELVYRRDGWDEKMYTRCGPPAAWPRNR
jgi:hypothetical protein